MSVWKFLLQFQFRLQRLIQILPFPDTARVAVRVGFFGAARNYWAMGE